MSNPLFATNVHKATQTNIEVSVLMTVYNQPFWYVQRAIDSVIKQAFNNVELLVIDDGSHHQLGSQIKQYLSTLTFPVEYFRHENIGQSQSINKYVMLCRGKYITIIDSDDEYKQNHLANCLQAIHGADLISSYTETIVRNEEDYYVPDKNDHTKLVHVDDCILFATLFGRKEVFNQLQFESKYSADSIFFEQSANIFRTKKANFRSYIYYRNVDNSVSATLKKQYSLHLS